MWNNIKKALRLVGLKEPNCLFIAANGSTDYLHFAYVDYDEDVEHIENKLKKLNVVFIAKYETLAIERELLWDSK
ncbi:hypothetical protein [Elizabethkingia anophelis]|uniref:hypothetical protein n=1 Tax=Elizabethkingia anophelis TaxID=1117645 RepID=UPI002226D761|nr:hypothetical protein [Elizabethkingia anophelis]MCW2463350.1 hypothetical protein [Elizabethkingia anophelis]MCW2467035.1 hypothetical protein [Elizabethkingia anophelis]MCW2470817.1 hypothetical protein [Elizabethkingia anophelis]HBI9690689.1 hypothetical protein [Elizabethkingia anophelis]HBI9694708.1 hypothetical protein [Elizabethkingia anophelis]